jgi:hypothetical protein
LGTEFLSIYLSTYLPIYHLFIVYLSYILRIISKISCQAQGAHACNPSYSRGNDQEDHVSKSAWANGSGKTLSQKKKKESQERAGGVAQGVGPEFKFQYHTNGKRKFLMLEEFP